MGATPSYGIMVHCHLRWNFAWQRPQHVMSRLSKRHPVVFLEDALPLPEGETEPRLEQARVTPHLLVATPMLKPYTGGAGADALIDEENGAAWTRPLDALIAGLRASNPCWEHRVHWFYTPAAIGARRMYDPLTVCYDCLDELASFKNAPHRSKRRRRN